VVSYVKIGIFELDDINQLLSIELASFKYPWLYRMFLNYVNNSSRRIIVAKLDYECVGYLAYDISDKDYVILRGVAVTPEERNKGIGSILLKYFHETMSGSGLDYIISNINENNLRGQMFLKHNGYICNKIFPNYFKCKETFNAYVMKKDIPKHRRNPVH